MSKVLNKNKIREVLHYFSREDANLLILYYGLFAPSLKLSEIKSKLGISKVTERINSLNIRLEEILKEPIIPKRRFKKEVVLANIDYFGEEFKDIISLYYGLKDNTIYNEYQISARYNVSPQYILGLITRMEAAISKMIEANNYHRLTFHRQIEVFRVHDCSNIYRVIFDLTEEEQEAAIYFYGLYDTVPHTIWETAQKMGKKTTPLENIIDRINIKIMHLLVLDSFFMKDKKLLTYYYGLENNEYYNYTELANLMKMERLEVKNKLKELDNEVEDRLNYERIKLLLKFRPKVLSNLSVNEIRAIMLYAEYKSVDYIAVILNTNEYEVKGIINKVLKEYNAIYNSSLEKKLKL